MEMAEVKWIKITTNVFDDEKIRYIESLPNGDETIVIWFKILCLAGKSNANGLLMMTDRIAYTDDMLASVFGRDIRSIQLALGIFESLEMIEKTDNKIYLLNWQKHQNAEKLDKIREDTRKRVAHYREQKRQNEEKCNDICVTGALQNGYSLISSSYTSESLSLEKEIYKEVIEYLNEKAGKNFKLVESNKKHINARIKEGFKLEDFKKVIDNKVTEWKNDDKMNQYLRPETLFSSKFQSYLNSEAKVSFNGKRKESITAYPTIDANITKDEEDSIANMFGNL